jgi:hypothetical protein
METEREREKVDKKITQIYGNETRGRQKRKIWPRRKR